MQATYDIEIGEKLQRKLKKSWKAKIVNTIMPLSIK